MSLALRDIAVIKADLTRLAATEALWSSSYLPEDQVAFRAEWRDLMDVLADILDADASGRLTSEESSELRDLARDALRALPMIERLGLALPPRATLKTITAAPAGT